MSLKILLLLSSLFLLSTSYTQQGNVLVLTDDDFPNILTQFSHILIQFYAPWCGHCKKLAPIFSQVADSLKEQGSLLRVAKVDSTQNSKSSGTYEIRGYPTLIFFLNGQQIPYTGQRNKQGMLLWLNKKLRDPVQKIDVQKYQQLKSGAGVSIVYHGDFTTQSNAGILTTLAIADDYNTYYWGTDLGQPAGDLQLLRDFDEDVSTSAIDEGTKNWIKKNQRPLILPFDERTIGSIFQQKKLGAILFNSEDSTVLLSAFTQAAKQYDGTQPLIFTEIPSSNEHIVNFAQYIKIDKNIVKLVIVDSGNSKKYVLGKEPTSQNILVFLGDHQASKYGLTEQIQQETEEILEQL